MDNISMNENNNLHEATDQIVAKKKTNNTKSVRIKTKKKTIELNKIINDLQGNLKDLNDFYMNKSTKELYDGIISIESGINKIKCN